MTVIPTRLRHHEILDAQLVRCRRVDSGFTRGAAAGLHWLTVGGPGPLTGILATSVDCRSIVHELDVAQAVIDGPLCPGRDYVRGLEHALLWAENARSVPPVPDLGPLPEVQR